MNIVPVEKNKPVKTTLKEMTQHQDRTYQFNQEANTPVISNLERSLSITGALLTRGGDLPNREVIAKAHHYAQIALAEAQMIRKTGLNHEK